MPALGERIGVSCSEAAGGRRLKPLSLLEASVEDFDFAFQLLKFLLVLGSSRRCGREIVGHDDQMQQPLEERPRFQRRHSRTDTTRRLA